MAGPIVDVDELVALAEVLSVTPDVLLSPPDAAVNAPAAGHAALREIRNLADRAEQLLTDSGSAAGCEALSGYVDRALRRVQIEVEELLAEARKKAESGGGTSRVPRPPRNYAA